MMGASQIRSESARAAARAALDNKVPLICEDASDLRRIPNWGDWEPNGWTKVEEYFVDSSGFGAPGEPALTFDQLADKLEREERWGDGFAIIEAGQFQIYIARYTKDVR
jgi:hypothetical protein